MAARRGMRSSFHVAPVKRLESLAPGWREPWDGRHDVLPLPERTIGGGPAVGGRQPSAHRALLHHQPRAREAARERVSCWDTRRARGACRPPSLPSARNTPRNSAVPSTSSNARSTSAGRGRDAAGRGGRPLRGPSPEASLRDLGGSGGGICCHAGHKRGYASTARWDDRDHGRRRSSSLL